MDSLLYTWKSVKHDKTIGKKLTYATRKMYASILLPHYSGRDGVPNHRRLDGLLNRLFRCISKKISKPRVTGLREGNSPITGEFPSQRASSAEHASIWWRHPDCNVSEQSFVSKGVYYRDGSWVTNYTNMCEMFVLMCCALLSNLWNDGGLVTPVATFTNMV